MKIGKVKNKSLQKFIWLINLTLDQRSIPKIKQIKEELNCCKGTAYTYRRALRHIFHEILPPRPPQPLPQEDPGMQQNLDEY